MRRTLRRVAGAIGVVLGLAGVLLLAAVWLTGSSFGKERARRFAEDWLAASSRIAGEVTLGHIDGGSLLNGVTVHAIAITGPDGRPFLQADSLSAAYDWLDLLRGRIAIRRVTAFGAVVNIEQLPGDSTWNFERVFPPSVDPPSPTGRLIAFRDVRLVGGRVIVRTPWEEAGGADAGRWVIEEAPGGHVRVFEFHVAESRSARVQWDAPADREKRIEIDALAGQARVLRDPVILQDAKGSVTLNDSLISIDLRSFRLPESSGSATGRIVRGAGWSFRIDMERFTLADMQWLDARVPTEGEGRALVHIRGGGGDDIGVRAEDLVLTAGETRITGAGGILVGRRVTVEGVDLRASPMDLAWVERALERSLPVRGRMSGAITADGPLSGLRTRGDVRLDGPDGRVSARWNGAVSIDGGFAARVLNLDVESLDLTLLAAVRPDFPVAGSVTGSLTLDGRLADGLNARGVLTHTGPAGARSVIDGGGAISATPENTSFDLRFDAAPLDLSVVAAAVPALEQLRGEVTGTIALRGQASDLTIEAAVQTTAGPAQWNARVSRSGETMHIVADGRVDGFVPARLGLIAEEASVSGAFSADVRGTSRLDLAGPIRVALDSATVRGLPIEAGRLDIVLDDGTARVDTAFIRTSGIEVAGSGAVGLDRDRQGRLLLRVSSASLAPLESWWFGEVADPTSPRVRGSVEGRATLVGSIASLDIDAVARLDGFGWDANQSARIAVDLAATGIGSDSAEWRLAAAIDSLLLLGRAGDSARVALDYAAGRTNASLAVWTDTLRALRGSAIWVPAANGGLLRVADLAFRLQDRSWALADTGVIHVGDGTARIEPLRIVPATGTGSLDARGTIALFDVDSAGIAEVLDFDVAVSRMPFGEFMSIVRSPVDAAGVMDATLRVTGTTERPVVSGQVTIRGVEFQATSLDLVTAQVDYANRNLRANATAYQAGREVMFASGSIPLDLAVGTEERRPDLPLSLTMRMDSFPAAFVLGPLPGFSELAGVIDGTISARGTTRRPTLDGTLLVRRGAATWDVTGVRYLDVEGTLNSSRDLVVTVDLTARTVDSRGRTPPGTRGGGARVTGQIDLEHPTDPGLALTVTADRILAARRRDADIVTTGRLNVSGNYRQPTIGGSLTIVSGNLYLDEIYRQYLIVQLEDPLLFNLVDTSLVSVKRVLPPTQSPFMRNLRIDNLEVSVNAGSWLRSREMDVEVTGDLVVIFDRQREDLRMSGTLTAIRGTYRLEYPPFARVFEVEGGTVEFPGTPGIDPLLDIVASYTARTRAEPLRIEAVLRGSLQVPRVSLRSDAEPPISESDLASYLFFGAPTWGIAAGSTGGGGAFGTLGRQALTATGLGYVASGLQTLAQSFGLVDYVGLTAAEAATPGQQSSIGNLLSSTRIELGRYLSPRVYVAYTQRLGSPANDAGVRLEWRYHPTYTLELFAEDRFARAPSITLSQAIAARKVYGFFIYREWTY